MKYLYLEKHITLIKEVKVCASKQEGILYSWIQKITIIKISLLLKEIYSVNKTTTKIPVGRVHREGKDIHKFTWNHRRLKAAKVTLNKSKDQGIKLPVLKFILASYRESNNVRLSSRQTHRPMETLYISSNMSKPFMNFLQEY